MAERKPYTVKELAEKIAQEAADIYRNGFTGQLSFTLHCKDGGIGRVSVVRTNDLPREEFEESDRQLRHG